MNETRIYYLLDRYKAGQLTAEETNELWEISEHDQVIEAITGQMHLSAGHPVYEPQAVSDAAFNRIVAVDRSSSVRRLSFMRRWVAAAAILLVFAACAYLLFRGKHQALRQQHVTADIAPGRNGAVLTLSDGSQIVLDSLEGTVAQQHGIRAVLQDGQLTYDPSAGGPASLSYNTMTTPKGRQFRLVLPDGTKVWLNAASSIRFPIAFTGNERRVEVKGEAYFEVAQNDRIPFKVSINGQAEVLVLGTHFNVHAYENEPAIRTTLLEGKIKVTLNRNGYVLIPGQQAEIDIAAQKIRIDPHPDMDKVMAWKNGLFNFEGAGLAEVMRQLERWYDIEVIYENSIPDIGFVGEISRNISLKDMLEVLERTKVHFRLEEGRRLIVE